MLLELLELRQRGCSRVQAQVLLIDVGEELL